MFRQDQRAARTSVGITSPAGGPSGADRRRRALLLVGLCLALSLPLGAVAEDRATAAGAVRLILLADPGCPYCARWDREVGDRYAASAEGRFAPLVRYLRGDPRAAGIADVRYSPTFVVMQGNREVGRIVGYPGEDFFWAQLGELLRKVGFEG